MSTLPKRIRERIITKKQRLDSHRPLPPSVVENLRKGLLIEYTHSSNAIEGNTLTLGETRRVIEEGLTIGENRSGNTWKPGTTPAPSPSSRSWRTSSGG